MPNLESSRLDVALSDLDAQGVGTDEVEVVGGGAFGVVDESNWIVCEQLPAPGERLDSDVRLVVDRSCDSASDEGAPDDAVGAIPTSQAAPTDEPAPPAVPITTPPPPAEPPATFVMPDLRGMNLQLAQDTLQSLGSILLDQEDASGLGRLQILDANWRVCTQSPAPGTVAPVETIVLLASVKLDETCP